MNNLKYDQAPKVKATERVRVGVWVREHSGKDYDFTANHSAGFRYFQKNLGVQGGASAESGEFQNTKGG